ncbi:NAD(P)-binding protein [Rhizodiscina lignyota]|uniref:NAD(P)-binding protein n=1 Tax=Rhizodiscina lignyota TaxID=1504668 RepID=A0A9P4M8Y5_9PEZI|nr:NAD(P)-binding protein [Rhizodiscina lignyota]
MGFFSHLIYSQWFITPPWPTQSFAGQTVIVTGANVGLGLESARHFTRLGAEKVILACRSVDKGEKAKSDIVSTTGKTGVVEVWQLDLSSYASVKAFAKRAEELPRLDCLLANAGISTQKFNMAEENEATITVNVVANFLLAFLLIPKLKETASRFDTRPRIAIVSSGLHKMTEIQERKKPGKLFDNLNNKATAKMSDRYNVTKLMDLLVVRAFVDEFGKDYPITMTAVDPGFCHSELMREVGAVQHVAKAVLHARTTEVGSRPFVFAAGAGPEFQGEYLANCAIDSISPFVTSAEGVKLQKRIWSELKDKLDQIEPGIMQRL